MKKIRRWLRDIFDIGDFNNLDMTVLGNSLNEPAVRSLWLISVCDELKRMNQEVDRRLLSGTEFGLTDLCARRKAYQDVLEAIVSAKRVVTQDVRHNPRLLGDINLDRVTA